MTNSRNVIEGSRECGAGRWIGWGVALAATSGLLLLAASPPWLGLDARAVLMRAFSTFCHQVPERSPHVGGVPLAVCHRCLGVYMGFVGGVLVLPFLGQWDRLIDRHARYVLAGALLPLAIDWLGDALRLWHNTPPSRWLTGGGFGLAAGYFLARALALPARPGATPAEPSPDAKDAAGAGHA